MRIVYFLSPASFGLCSLSHSEPILDPAFLLKTKPRNWNIATYEEVIALLDFCIIFF